MPDNPTSFGSFLLGFFLAFLAIVQLWLEIRPGDEG